MQSMICRQKGLSRRDVLAVLLTAAVIALLFATGILNQQQVWAGIPYTMKFVSSAGGDAGDARQEWKYALDAGDTYGDYGAGPGYNLDRGTYRFKWRVDGDGVNRIRLSAKNGARITPDVFETDPKNWDGDVTFTVEEAVNSLQITAEFASGTFMTVYDYRLYSPEYTDHAWGFSLVLVCGLILFLMWEHGKISQEGLADLTLLGFAVLLVSVPCLKDDMIRCYDTQYHGARLLNLKEGLLAGDFPVRMGRFSYNGYGAVTSMFYPDLYLYPFAFMMVCGASMTFAMNLMTIVLNIVTALSMYFCGRRIFRDRRTALMASAIYVCALYRLCDLYSRGALGEATAMAVFPFFLAGLYEVIFGDRGCWPLLGVGAALIFQCHLLSTVQAGCLALAVSILFLPRILRERRLSGLALASGLALLLCISFLMPFIHYTKEGVSASSLIRLCEDTAVAPAQLLLWAGGDMASSPTDGRLNDFAVCLSLPMVLGTALLIYNRFTRRERDGRDRAAVLLAVGGVIAALMTTTLFPWAKLSVLTRGASRYLQFPFRLLVLASPLLSLAAAHGFARFDRTEGMETVLAVTALSVFFAMPLITDETRSSELVRYGTIVSPNMAYTEYLLPGTNLKKSTDREAHAEDVTLSDYRKDGTDIVFTAVSQSGGMVSLPLYGFSGYEAKLDGAQLPVSCGQDNRLTVAVPAGASGTVHVRYVGRIIWRFFDAVSALTAAAVFVLLIRKRKPKDSPEQPESAQAARRSDTL